MRFSFESVLFGTVALFCGEEPFSGLEVDGIIELDDGQYGAVELKLGADQQDATAAKLLRFRD